MYESVRPFLEALKKADPYKLPFANYIRHAAPSRVVVEVPAYAAEPGCKWDLSVSMRKEKGYDRGQVLMNATDAESVGAARRTLKEGSEVDPR
jgi:hypothetical protein